MIAGVDFQILSMERMDNVFRHGGKPAYQARVQSFHSQLTFLFDDRHGSWATSKTDENGRFKEPSPGVSAALAAEKSKVESALSKIAGKNPFVSGSSNPFLA